MPQALNFPFSLKIYIVCEWNGTVDNLSSVSDLQLQYRMSLTKVTADLRSSVIRKGSISYNFNIILEANQYYGLAEISFYLQNLNFTELPIDFRGHIIEQVIINSVKIDPLTNESQIVFRKANLQKGRNKISVMYTNLYNNEQWGCISYMDQGQQFVYTDFEPYGANRVFPCFDQPNLKANFKLAVVTPTTWSVNSNEPAKVAQKFHADKFKNHVRITSKESFELLQAFLSRVNATSKMTLFDFGEQLPTYIFCFTAGNYERIDSSSGSVPMSIYTAPSMYKQLKFYSNFIFDVTQKTMTFFEELFGVRYPFKKYDQIWVRDMRFLAMENAAIVTFDESSLPLDPTETDYYDLAEVIAHELSHHWFGNYVTMQWWDDLWLNQSFANFISMFALEKINDQLDRKVLLPTVNFRDTKVKGYLEDSRDNATHPIRATVEDTTVAQSIFDGIVYGKGGGVMKQLYFLVGDANYPKALQSYFSKYSWSNADIDDLLSDMSSYFPGPVSVAEWKDTWLQKPSVSIFQSIWDSADLSVDATLMLRQRPFSDKFPFLRPHQIQIAFFSQDGKIAFTQQTLSTATDTVVQYDGTKQIKAIFVNSQDYSFLENYIDPVSLQFFMDHIRQIQDDTTRALIWYNISAMVKQGLIRLDDYVDFVVNNLFAEPLDIVLGKMLRQLYQWLNSYLTEPDNLQLFALIFDTIYQQLQAVPATSKDRVKILTTQYINYALNDDQVNQLIDWLTASDSSLADKPLTNNDLRWAIVKKAYGSGSLTLPQKQALYNVNLLKTKDSSSRAADAKVVCDAIVADDATMETLYQSFRTNELSMSERRLRAEGWRNVYHYELLTDVFKDRYFADIITLSTKLEYIAFEFFYTALQPIDDYLEDQLARYQDVVVELAKKPELAAHVTNIYKIIDDLTLRIANVSFNTDSNKTLTQARAIDRSDLLQDVVYNCHFGFEDGAEQYTAMVEITFTLQSLPKVLQLDFAGTDIFAIGVNNQKIEPSVLIKGEYVLIPRIYLALGSNVVSLHYANNFNNDGLGCLSYTDPQDDRQYICTNFQPNGAHRFLPCFDQPDLKAPIFFNVITSNPNWTVVSNQNSKANGSFSKAAYVAQSQPVSNVGLLNAYLTGKSGQFVIFKPTLNLAPYLFTLIAGEYASVELNPSKRYNNIPMTVYATVSNSAALAAAADFFFEITSLSIQYYETNLQSTYPFSKYDTVFSPQIHVGAMENAGLVAFKPSYLNYFKEATALQDKVELATIIAHECGHMWFGNYVTPKWWSEIWLSQSLAEFFGYHCIASIQPNVKTITIPPGLVQMVRIRQIAPGYHADQSSATHPLINTVNSTSLAAALFDGINYEKGATLLKQLLFIMGSADFFNALKDYLGSRAFGTTVTAQDLISSFQKYFKNDKVTFDDWAQMWLSTASPNVLSVSWDKKDLSPNASLTILNTNTELIEGQSRFHQINVAFFRSDGSYTPQLVTIVPNDQTNETVVPYDGSQGYVAILLNYDHQSFVKVRIDDDSMTFFQANINKIPDATVRMLIWFYANEQVRDQVTKVVDHWSAALNLLQDEPDDTVLQFALNFLDESTGSYLPAKDNQPLRSSIFNFILQQLTSLNPSPQDQQNRVVILTNQLARFCATLDHIDILNLWRQGQYPNLSNISISTSQAWQVVELVYTSDRYDLNEKTAIFSGQEAIAPGSDAALYKNTCLTLVADSGTLEAAYDLLRAADTSFTVKNSLVKGWNNPVHQSFLQIKKDDFFRDITVQSKEISYGHLRFFYTNLRPMDDQVDDSLSRLQSIFLRGAQMEGASQDLVRIADDYQLQSLLFAFNSLTENKQCY